MGDLGTADGRDELGAHLDDSSVLCFRSDHEPGHIVEEHDWGVLLIADSYEGRGFCSLMRIDDRDLVCDNTNGMPCNCH